MKNKLFAVAAALTAAVMSFAAQAAEELRVGTHPTFAPFEFMDTHTREYVGFDMDLIREIGKRAGYDVKIVNMGFDGLIPALFSGTIDIAASGITITEERKKKVDFCDPYYQAGQGLLVRTESSGTYKDLKSLEGKVVAVQIGTTGADLAKTIKGAEIKAFNTGAEAFMDLKMRGSEAVITDRPVIGYFMDMIDSSAVMDDAGNFSAVGLFFNNLRAMFMTVLYGFIPFLFLPALSLGINAVILGVMAAYYSNEGISLLAFFAGILPHGVFELPALILSLAAGLFLCQSINAYIRHNEKGVMKPLLLNILRVVVLLVLPLLVIAAVMETYVTPALMQLFL